MLLFVWVIPRYRKFSCRPSTPVFLLSLFLQLPCTLRDVVQMFAKPSAFLLMSNMLCTQQVPRAQVGTWGHKLAHSALGSTQQQLLTAMQKPHQLINPERFRNVQETKKGERKENLQRKLATLLRGHRSRFSLLHLSSKMSIRLKNPGYQKDCLKEGTQLGKKFQKIMEYPGLA